MGEEFEKGWLDDESATNPNSSPDCVNEFDEWVDKNQALWALGVRLATSARYYQQEYAHYPFYKSGYFNPN